MKQFLFSILVLLILNPLPSLPLSPAQQHETRALGTRRASLTFDEINLRLHNIADRYHRKYGQLPRVAIHDIAYPATREEWISLNKNTVLLITVVTQSADELPLKRAYLHSAKGDEELRFSARYYSKISDDALIRDTLGAYREDVLCLVPVAAIISSKDELRIDFATQREGFVVATFPNAAPAPFLEEGKDRLPDPGVSVAERVLANFIKREFPDFVGANFSRDPFKS